MSTDLSTLATALSQNKTVFMMFTTSWCQPCQRIKPVFKELADTYQNQGFFYVIDCDEHKELANKNDVTSYPTFLFVKKDQVLVKQSGANKNWLTTAVTKHL